ncbi:MAG TPA: allantoinase AllB [Thermoanaerobaculia bacterium]
MIVRSQRVVTATGLRAASIHISGGRIERVAEFDDVPAGAPILDYSEFVIMPGIVDSHVHVNEPGRTEWEGFVTATNAAAAGGVTTIVDMPLNSIPPTTSVAALLAKAESMSGKLRVDVGLWGGAVPGNANELRAMLREGALGFKCFLIDSGVAEFGHLDRDGLEAALVALRDQPAPLLVHAELAEGMPGHEHGEPQSYRRYLASRPRLAENLAIERVASLSQKHGTRAHIVHLSSSEGLEILARARDAHIPLSAETTPHYLYFDAESIPDAHPEYKCAPPIRERENRERLWRGVDDELLAAIVSDHSPCTPELKKLGEGDVEHAWGGIASMQFALPIVWTAGRRRGLTLERLSTLMSAGPAKLANLDGRKGAIAAGNDADLVVFAPDEPFVVTPELIEHRHKVTPYAGRELFGVVKATFVRGVNVLAEDVRRGEWLRG